MTKFTFTEKKDTRSGFGAGLLEAGKKNKDVVALCADLTGSLKMDAFQKEFPERGYPNQTNLRSLRLTLSVKCKESLDA